MWKLYIASVSSHLSASPHLLSLLVNELHRLSVAFRNKALGLYGQTPDSFLVSTAQCLLLLPLMNTILREILCVYKFIYFSEQGLLCLLYNLEMGHRKVKVTTIYGEAGL